MFKWTDLTSNFVQSNRLWRKAMTGFGSKSQGVAQSYRLLLKSDQFWQNNDSVLAKTRQVVAQSDRFWPCMTDSLPSNLTVFYPI